MTIRLLNPISCAILGAVLIAVGCSKKSSESSTPSSGSQSPDPKNPGASGKPDIVTDPVTWRADFKNGQAAMNKYNGKVIEMTGSVARVGYDQDLGAPCIYLKAEGEWTVRCATADKHPWLKVVPGSTVKVKGKRPLAISFQNPHLAEAVVADTGPLKPEFVTALQLTKAFLVDRKATAGKYHEKWVNLEGEIIDAKIVAGNDMIVRLKGEGNAIIICSIEKTGIEGARPGQNVKVFGQLNVIEAGTLNVIYIYASGLTELK